MTDVLEAKTTFPSEVSKVSSRAVERLDEREFFASQFRFIEQARDLFHYRFSQSLLPKFISGDDIQWNQDEFESVFSSVCVEQALAELESEGEIYMFDDIIVKAGGAL